MLGFKCLDLNVRFVCLCIRINTLFGRNQTFFFSFPLGLYIQYQMSSSKSKLSHYILI